LRALPHNIAVIVTQFNRYFRAPGRARDAPQPRLARMPPAAVIRAR
jgi:hypothetical protein